MAWKTRFKRIYDIRLSVRHSSVRPSVRYSSVRPYPRFILTRRHAEGTAQRNMLLIMLSDPPLHADRLIANQEYKHMQMRVHQSSRTIWYCESRPLFSICNGVRSTKPQCSNDHSTSKEIFS